MRRKRAEVSEEEIQSQYLNYPEVSYIAEGISWRKKDLRLLSGITK